jgi:DNA-binding transcriptional LysR family regulator
MGDDVNTTQLECFVQVALSLSFRRAAEELHLSQPTVSKQVASLERDLGGALFVRSTRHVLLTERGEAFLQDAQDILRLAYAAEERARRHGNGEELVVAYADSNEPMRLVPVFDRLRRERAGIHVLLAQGPRDANIARLQREEVDVVMGFGGETLLAGGIAFTVLVDCGLSCVVRKDSPLAACEEVGREDVEGLPQVICLPPSLRRRGYRARAALPSTGATLTTQCATSSEAYALVDAGFGYAIVPTVYTMPDPFHRVLRWRDGARASYGFYSRGDDSRESVRSFATVSGEEYGRI